MRLFAEQHKTRTANLLIHAFALAHAAAAYVLIRNGLDDELVLTVLTIILLTLLPRLYGYPRDLSAAIALVGCFVGFFLGTQGAQLLFSRYPAHYEYIPSAVTFTVTELLGWAAFLIVSRRPVARPKPRPDHPLLTVVQAGVLFLLVILLRLLYVNLYVSLQTKYGFHLSDFMLDVAQHTTLFLLAVALDVLFILYLNKVFRHGKQPVKRLLSIIGYLVLISSANTVLLNLDFFRFDLYDAQVVFDYLQMYFMATLLLHTLFTVGFDVVYYATVIQKRALDRAISARNRIKYQYAQLKNQLNPHFLFNSLNMLDYLVHTDSQRASRYIGKLADVYRYLLSIEQKQTVTMDEELRFCLEYVELLKERFGEGLEVRFDVAARYGSWRVIPSSVQLLIENATKHNVISPEHPLTVDVFMSSDDRITVRNNLQPRMHRAESFGIGLQHISAQSRTVFGRDIEVERTESYFTVKLPVSET